MIVLGLFLVAMVVAIQELFYGWIFWNNFIVILSTIILLGVALWFVIDYARISIKGPDFILLNNNETNKPNSANFSREAIEKIIKKLMETKGLNKRIINAFKAKIWPI